MIRDFAFVLFCGKASSFIYNFIQSKKQIKHSPEYTYERKNICKKTCSAMLFETLTYFIIFLVAAIVGK